MPTSEAALAPALLAEARAAVEVRLAAWAARLRQQVAGPRGEALAYALTTPGKRVRAALVNEAYRACGGRSDAIAAVGAAVETVHAYSLVHDDLPCMDDDDLRRGRATVHRAFDVAIATEVGYLLVPVSARVLAEAVAELGRDARTLGRMAAVLYEAGGIEGMVGGQWLDLEAEQRTLALDELIAVHAGKTGALIRASCVLGALAAGAPDAAVAAVATYGNEVGVAFQIADDVLDATSTSEVLGKTAGRDAVMQKSTYVACLGVEGARREADRHAQAGIAALRAAGLADGGLAALARYIVERTS